MLRVGLTGELGSGKSTVARLFAEAGAIVLSSDEMGRAMMQPGQAVFAQIVERFGRGVLMPDGTLNRPELARLAFDPTHPRVEELNSIVHPAVLAEQERRLGEIVHADPGALVVIESALLFTTRHGGEQPWRRRFDAIVLVTAPDEVKIARFAERVAGGRAMTAGEREVLKTDARRRLEAQRISPELAAGCLVIENKGSLKELRRRTQEVFRTLQARQNAG